MRIKTCLLSLLLLTVVVVLQAQYPAGLELKLSDGTTVQLCRQQSPPGQAPVYYYAPVNLRVSEVEGRSEFSFLAYRQDSISPIQGGLLHLLMVWGLSGPQFQEAESLLAARLDSTAILGGSVWLDPDEAHPTAEIVSDSSLAELLRRSIRNSARTPLNAGSKLAVSFSFSAADARQIDEAFKDPKAFEGIKFRLYFQSNTHLFRGCLPSHFRIEGDLQQWLEELK